MAARLEQDVENTVVRWAQSQGFFVRKLQFISQRGATDRLFLSPNGDIIFAEFKRQGSGRLSPAQKEFRRELAIRGLIHYVFTQEHEAVRQLEKFL